MLLTVHITEISVQFSHSPVDCEWDYGPCGKCSKTCGRGVKQCLPFITQQPRNGGKECPDFVLKREIQELECSDASACQRGK